MESVGVSIGKQGQDVTRLSHVWHNQNGYFNDRNEG
jgi:hypothetical protein